MNVFFWLILLLLHTLLHTHNLFSFLVYFDFLCWLFLLLLQLLILRLLLLLIAAAFSLIIFFFCFWVTLTEKKL